MSEFDSDSLIPPAPPLVPSAPGLAPCEQGANKCLSASSLDEACRRAGLSLQTPPKRFCIHSVEPILQLGPTCGPVALAMMLDGELSPETLVGMAREAGFSNNGEMFSCEYMALLARDAAKRIGMHLDITVHDDLLDKTILEELYRGALLLVPYDSDHNFSPCLRRGHKAHWALIVGVFELEHLSTELAQQGRELNSNDNIFVLARHGKSKHLTAWRMTELASSNGNLFEFPVHRKGKGLQYVEPAGGISGKNGLCSRFILVQGLHS